jgi:hypothetical protein
MRLVCFIEIAAGDANAWASIVRGFTPQLTASPRPSPARLSLTQSPSDAAAACNTARWAYG